MNILPCACCGGKATVENVCGRGWIVSCENVLCVCQQYGHPSKEDAIEDWNRLRYSIDDELFVKWMRSVMEDQ